MIGINALGFSCVKTAVNHSITHFDLKANAMKELTEYKELDAATFDNSMLPLEGCYFWDDVDGMSQGAKSLLRGVEWIDSNLRFIDSSGDDWQKCAEITSRYPRDVPEGVTPLPEDKPFLAYVGKEEWVEESECWILYSNLFWVNPKEKGNKMTIYEGLVLESAIDVSTKWAREKFPDFVEAMEYEPILNNGVRVAGGIFGEVVGHRLGNITYDLSWNKSNFDLKPEAEIDLLTKECIKSNDMIKDLAKQLMGISDEEREPPDYDEYDQRITPAFSPPRSRKDYFEAGKARGKWEATMWKYKTVEDIANAIGMGTGAWDCIDPEELIKTARKLEDDDD